MINSPCLNCPDRRPACSSKCDKYTQFRVEFDKQKEWLKTTKSNYYIFHNRPYLHTSKSSREKERHGLKIR